jgi:hypothetical protein
MSEREEPYPQLPEHPGADDDLVPEDGDELVVDVDPEEGYTYDE